MFVVFVFSVICLHVPLKSFVSECLSVFLFLIFSLFPLISVSEVKHNGQWS